METHKTQKNDSNGGLEMTQNTSTASQRETPNVTRNNVTALSAPAKPEDSLLSSFTPPQEKKWFHDAWVLFEKSFRNIEGRENAKVLIAANW